MSLLDRAYEIEIDLKDGSITQDRKLGTCNKDVNIFNLYVTLIDNTGTIISNSDLGNYKVELYVVLPNILTYNVLIGTVDGTNDRMLFDLTQNETSIVGIYKCQFKITKDTEIVYSNPIKYKVESCQHEGLTSAFFNDIKEISDNPFEIDNE